MDFSPKHLKRLLEARGWVLRRITGSHHIYFHPEQRKTIPVPVHGNRDVPVGTFYAILKRAGVEKDDV